jgi:hypothetical protein
MPTLTRSDRTQFSRQELRDIGRAKRIVAIAIKALEFAAARFAKQKSHGLSALWTDRRWAILGHGTHADQARVLFSLSPITAEDGAVMSDPTMPAR